MVGLGEPREVRAGVVGGSYFDVMGLRPVLGRLLNQNDDGPNAAGACVLTYRFWSTSLKSDPTVIGKTVRLGDRNATIIGVLEPSVPYPAQTEIIANVVTSPHHLSATMVAGTRASYDRALRAACSRSHAGTSECRTASRLRLDGQSASRSVFARGKRPSSCRAASRPDQFGREDCPLGLTCCVAADLHHRVLERRKPHSLAFGATRR